MEIEYSPLAVKKLDELGPSLAVILSDLVKAELRGHVMTMISHQNYSKTKWCSFSLCNISIHIHKDL